MSINVGRKIKHIFGYGRKDIRDHLAACFTHHESGNDVYIFVNRRMTVIESLALHIFSVLVSLMLLGKTFIKKLHH